MPHLGIDTTFAPTDSERHDVTECMTDLYTRAMDTDSGHVAVTVRSHPSNAIALGRAESGPIVILHADIRRGRPLEQRRSFALAVIDWFKNRLEIPRPNVKVVFTQHEGDEMMGTDLVGGEWAGDGSSPS